MSPNGHRTVFPEEEGVDTGFLTRNVHYPTFQMKELRHGVVKNICPRPQSQWTPGWIQSLFCPSSCLGRVGLPGPSRAGEAGTITASRTSQALAPFWGCLQDSRTGRSIYKSPAALLALVFSPMPWAMRPAGPLSPLVGPACRS